jgi:hypothetical protein
MLNSVYPDLAEGSKHDVALRQAQSNSSGLRVTSLTFYEPIIYFKPEFFGFQCIKIYPGCQDKSNIKFTVFLIAKSS